MKEFTVRLPIVGYVDFVVEAETKEEAIDKAWDMDCEEDGDLCYERMEYIVKGNVFHGECNSISIVVCDEIE